MDRRDHFLGAHLRWKETTRLYQFELGMILRVNICFNENITLGILCYVNLVNYMDRLNVAAVLNDVKEEYALSDDKISFLELIFVLAYMAFAPIFGYLGDRYSRRTVMAFGITLWSVMTLCGSYTTNFALFAIIRALVGIGESAFSVIAPTIISDLFTGHVRTKMFAIFHLFVPVGSGLGFIAGSLAGIGHHWRWALRVTPFMGLAGVALVTMVMQNPVRGHAEGANMKHTPFLQDLHSLAMNPSFMLTTLSYTCEIFTESGLTWWGPKLIHRGMNIQTGSRVTQENVELNFGLITIGAGLIGVPVGAWLGTALIQRFPSSHPVVCGVSVLASAPVFILVVDLCDRSSYGNYITLLIGLALLNINWPIVSDITMYVVIPPRRATAEAVKIFIACLFGDAFSPYAVGLLSELFKKRLSNGSERPSDFVKFKALQYGMILPCILDAIGGVFYLFTAIYIVRDKTKVEEAVTEWKREELNVKQRPRRRTTR